MAPHHATAVADPDRFCRELAALTLPVGGWAVYGAQRMVVELLGGNHRDHHFLLMQDTALDWLHAQGVPSARLTGYEMDRWAATRGAWAGGNDRTPSDPVVVMLRSFVAATDPVLAALRSGDENGAEVDRRGRTRGIGAAVGAVARPSTAEWATLGRQARVDWWVDRIGTLVVSLVTASGLTPVADDRLTLRPALAAAGRGLVLCALAHEWGVTDHVGKVRLLASVLFDKPLSPSAVAAACTGPAELLAAVLAELRDSGSQRSRALASGRAAWQLGRALLAVRDDLCGLRDSPSAGGRIPGLAAVSEFRRERAALRATASAGEEWLEVFVSTGFQGDRHDR